MIDFSLDCSALKILQRYYINTDDFGNNGDYFDMLAIALKSRTIPGGMFFKLATFCPVVIVILAVRVLFSSVNQPGRLVQSKFTTSQLLTVIKFAMKFTLSVTCLVMTVPFSNWIN